MDRQKAASLVFQLVYAPLGHPTPATIAQDLTGLAALFMETNFERARAGAPPAWFKAQMRYLKHARIRPSGPVRGATKPRVATSVLTSYKSSWSPRVSSLKCTEGHNIVEYVESDDGSCDECEGKIHQHDVVFDCRVCGKYWCTACAVNQAARAGDAEDSGAAEDRDSESYDKGIPSPGDPEAEEQVTEEEGDCLVVGACAAGARFANVFANQTHSMVLEGLYASYQAKLWAMTNGRAISLGTVGKERDWRNKQRRARNKGRSRADAATVNLLILVRHVQEVAARTAGARRREQGIKSSRPDREHGSALAAEGLAAAILHGQTTEAPLAMASNQRTAMVTTPGGCELYL